MNTAAEIEPPWLQRLEAEEPRAAQYFHADPREITRLDAMLEGIGDVQIKLDLLRLAYNLHMKPNDPTFHFMVQGFRMQRLLGKDVDELIRRLTQMVNQAGVKVDDIVAALHDGITEEVDRLATFRADVLDAIGTATGETRTVLLQTSREIAGELDGAKSAVVAEIADVNRKLDSAKGIVDDLPNRMGAILSNLDAIARAKIDQAGAEAAVRAVDSRVNPQVERIVTQLDVVAKTLTTIETHFKPVAATAEKAAKSFPVKLASFERVSLLFSVRVAAVILGVGLLIGAGTSTFASSVFGWGLPSALREDVAYGRVYALVYPRLESACKAQINAILTRR